MRLKRKIGGLKSKNKKILIISILTVLIALVAIFCIIKFTGGKEDIGENSFSRRVRQILNSSVEPYSEDDEEYISGEEEKVQYKLKVNKKNNVIVVYKKDSKGEYSEAFKAMTCSVGWDVPLGKYKTSDRYVWKIVNGNVWSQYATRLEDSIMFQSVPFSEKSKDSLIIKYYNQLGVNCNAYAIRLNVADAKWIVENVAAGTVVEIFEDDDIGPLGKPNVLSLSDDELWDPSDPDPKNPGNSTKLSFEGLENRTIERGIAVDYLSGVKVVNNSGAELSVNIEVDSDVDIFKCGTYDVVYSVRDAGGAVVEKSVQFKVVDTLKPAFSGLPSKIAVLDPTKVDKTALKDGIYVIDNNQFLSSDKIEVKIPDNLKDGDYITFSVSDDYGNNTSVEIVCTIDTTPPEIQLNNGVSNVIAIDQIVDETFAISRVSATDSGTSLSRENIMVDISTNEWGYTFNYTVTDESGLTAQLQNTVTYPMYSIEVPDDTMVDDLTNLSLLDGVVLRDSLGNACSADQIKVESSLIEDDKHLIKYVYEYSSPLGTKKTEAERTVTIIEVVEEDENVIDDNNDNEITPEEPVDTEIPEIIN